MAHLALDLRGARGRAAPRVNRRREADLLAKVADQVRTALASSLAGAGRARPVASDRAPSCASLTQSKSIRPPTTAPAPPARSFRPEHLGRVTRLESRRAFLRW